MQQIIKVYNTKIINEKTTPMRLHRHAIADTSLNVG